jgi:hypothetical protein
MKSGRLSLLTFILAVMTLFIAIAARGQPFPLSSPNAVSNNPVVNTNIGPNTVLPSIEIDDVPMSEAIARLARRGEINYIIDSRVMKWWRLSQEEGGPHEPRVSIHWKNLTAKDALVRLLREDKLALVDDPATGIPWVTYAGQSIPSIDPNSLPQNTKIESTNTIPLIEFQDVPVTVGLENLARQAGINYLLDPRISFGVPDENGESVPEPLLNLYWQNITAAQAFIAVCESCGFAMIRLPGTSIFLLRAQHHPVKFVDASLFGPGTNGVPVAQTNKIPLIEFQGVPLTAAFENLARQARIQYMLDPSVGYGRPDENGETKPEPILSFRLENVTAAEAFMALCANYDMAVTRDPATGVLRLAPAQ